MTKDFFDDIFSVVVVLWMLEGPTAGGAHAWAPFLLSKRERGYLMAQKFMTYEQQLNKLQNDKGLSIPDKHFAQKTLEEISYYSLISGYKEMFLHPASRKYKYGVTFNEVVAFYHFDEQLRSIFLKYILQVERHLKSMISYYFTEKYGESQSQYLNPNHFDYIHHSKQVQRLVASLNKTITLPSPYRYITHHARKYHNVPLWVATNAMTLGQTSAFYQYMSNDIQVKVSKAYPQYTEKQLHQFITVLAKCRNVCAHGERLFDFRTIDMIPDTLLHIKLNILCKKGLYQNGKKDLFAVVIALRYLTNNDDFKTFKTNLTKIINKVLKQCPHLTEEQLLKKMGFPKNWAKITRYKK